MGAVYATLQGFSFKEVSLLMGLPLIGVIASQYPIGMLSDRFDRRKVLTIFTFLSSVLAIACIFAANTSFAALVVVMTGFGCVALPLYSLAIAHANDYLEPDQLLGAAGKLVLIFGIGASGGPLVAGAVMEAVGPRGFFIYLAVTYLLIGIFALYRMVKRESLPLEEQGDAIMAVLPTSSVAVAAVVEEQFDSASDNGEPEQ